MSPGDPQAQRQGPGAGERRADQPRTVAIGRRLLNMGLALLLVLSASAALHAQAGNDWIGKRVVQRARAFKLQLNDEAVERTGNVLDFYQVEQADGPSLLLKSQRQGCTGWAAAREVVEVDKAIDYFTGRIGERPQDAFPYAMRAFLEQDRNELDPALRDYNQAIKLDPRDPVFYCGRGTAWHSRNDHARAIADFDLAIRLDPKNTFAYIGRGSSRAALKEFIKAIADYSEAIWIDPLAIAAYDNRGLAWQSKREYEKAVVDYNLAIRLDPEHAFAFCHRGNAWAAQRKFDKAIADFNEAIRLDPRYADPYSALAWLLATCPDGRVRDGAKAVERARKACELTQWKQAAPLETLAAACASAGDFESAVTWQTKANALDPGGEHGARGQVRVQLYREKKPYRQPSP